MADAIRSTTQWPSTPHPVSPAVKAVINSFFVIVNDKSDDGTRLYNEVFTRDGTWRSPGRAYIGSQIIGSTDGSWKGLVSRVHDVHKVFFFNEASDEFMMFGKALYVLENGASVNTELAARCVIDDPRSDTPKLKYFQGYTVCLIISNTSNLFSMTQVCPYVEEWADRDHVHYYRI